MVPDRSARASSEPYHAVLATCELGRYAVNCVSHAATHLQLAALSMCHSMCHLHAEDGEVGAVSPQSSTSQCLDKTFCRVPERWQ